MLQELKIFARLFFYENPFKEGFFVSLLIIFINSGLYLADYFHLMRRKSDLETLFNLIPPCFVAVIGSFLAAFFIHVPEPGTMKMVKCVLALSNPGLCAALLCLPALYLLLWSFVRIWRIRQSPERKKSWLLSCIPDYFFCAVTIAGSLVKMSGIALPQRVIWFYLHCVCFLLCKDILLLSCVPLFLFSVKITVFRWREQKSPSAFLFRYFLLYDNALFRISLFYSAIILSLVFVLLDSTDLDDETFKTASGLLLAGFLIAAFASRPARQALKRFGVWSRNPKSLMEMFCREYFLDEPVYRDHRYTVTRHFLIDEQAAATVYYWPCLKEFSGWCYSKKGRVRILSFTDQTRCMLTEEDAKAAEQVIAAARRELERRGPDAESPM